MSWDEDTLDEVYHKTDGKCHICGKKLSRINYGSPGSKGAWEIEHSNPRAEGGTDHLNNLYPAYVTCNRSKGTRSSRSARAEHGRTRAPYSRQKKQEKRQASAVKGAVVFGTILGLLFGVKAGVAGASISGLICYNQDPDDD